VKYFYSHLIEIESVITELDQIELSKDEKEHLAKLLDSSLHHHILDAILSELSDSEKRVFMQHITEGNHEQIWRFLNGKIDGVEEKIKKAADGLKNELEKDIKQAKRIKKEK